MRRDQVLDAIKLSEEKHDTQTCTQTYIHLKFHINFDIMYECVLSTGIILIFEHRVWIQSTHLKKNFTSTSIILIFEHRVWIQSIFLKVLSPLPHLRLRTKTLPGFIVLWPTPSLPQDCHLTWRSSTSSLSDIPRFEHHRAVVVSWTMFLLSIEKKRNMLIK